MIGLGIGLENRQPLSGGAFAFSKLSSIIPAEMIATSFYQEDVATGLVSSWDSGGANLKTASQASGPLQPSKLANQRGVMFSAGTKHNMTWNTENQGFLLHRWWITIARSNVGALTAGQAANVFAANGNATSNTNRQPKVQFVNPNLMGSAIFDTASRNINIACTNDVEVWNVILGYRRGFIHQAIVNGVAGISQAFHSWLPNNSGGATSFFGDPTNNLNANVAIDCAIIGQGELTDDLIDKIVGWAMWRAGRPSDLPIGHPYRSTPPSGMANPTRYIHNAAAYAAWDADLLANRFVNRGLAPPAITGYSTVMFDDFVDPSAVSDSSAEGSNIWFAPTWLGTIGVFAGAQAVSASPSSYVHDAGATTMSLRLLYNSGWKTGSFASVTKNGQGRYWGKGIFEIKFKFRKNGVDGAIPAPRPGLFPAFWSYGVEHMFWITRNRLETDFWEYDGLDGSYINVSQHVHVGNIPFSDPDIVAPGPDRKIAGYPVKTVTDPDFAGTIDIYDGNYHTYYMQIEDDYTYIVLDGEEIARCQTSAELAAEKYILVDLAYDPAMGAATIDIADTYDFVIDYIKVRQKETQLATAAVGFSARAALTGTAMDGETLTVTPNSTGQIHYRWYRDGVPMVGAITNTYVLATADIGHKVRCHVQNLSLDTKPFSWTVESAVVIAIPAFPADVIDGTGQVGTYLYATGTGPRQWKRNGVDIAGETTASYLVVAADIGANITSVNVSTLASNIIVGTWVMQTLTGPFDLDMDPINLRYWFGAEFTEANFELLSWVPDAINGSLINKVFSTGSAPWPGWDSSGFSVVAIASSTDNAVDTAIMTFNDGTVNNQEGIQQRWSTGNAARQVTTTAGSTHLSQQGDVMTSGVQYKFSAGFKLNDFWFLDGVNKKFIMKTSGARASGVTRMSTGASPTGTNVMAGSLDRLAVIDGVVAPLEIQLAAGETFLHLDYGGAHIATDSDGLDAFDIFGDGYPAVVNSCQSGVINLYRQQVRGRFTRTQIRSTNLTGAKIEGVCFADHKGDGFYRVFVVDQDLNNIRMYEPTVPGDYEQTDWTETTIASVKNHLQDIKKQRISDDRDTLVYTYEGTTGGTGGIGKLRWASTWTDTFLYQNNGAWGVAPESFSNNDLCYNCRGGGTGGNPGGTCSINRITQAGVNTVLYSNPGVDLVRPTIGDFFGNGTEDVAFCKFFGTDGIAFVLLDGGNSYASTSINHVAQSTPTVSPFRNWGVHNLHYKVNGRDALVLFCEATATQWEWSGSAWAVVRSWPVPQTPFKADDTMARMRITNRLRPDIVVSDNFTRRIVVLALA